LKIAVQAQAFYINIIRELLSPWDISFTSPERADVAIAYKEKPLETRKSIVVPSDSVEFLNWTREINIRAEKKPAKRALFSIAATPKALLTTMPKTIYKYAGSAESDTSNPSYSMAIQNDNYALLALDIVNEYKSILDSTFNARSSLFFRVATGLPIPYGIAPKRIRDLSMKTSKSQTNYKLDHKLPLDALRFMLSTAIEELVGSKLHKKSWHGRKYVCLVTHDVDTREGLRRADSVKRLEERYNIPSAWYIPSKHYPLSPDQVKDLANSGEVGVHGMKHDGELSQTSNPQLTERLLEAKRTLEKIAGAPVEGFRAPLLQHSISILDRVKEAGYSYDTSVPTWEPKHPRTMQSHGLGTVFPMSLNGFTEIPISVVQDHQMLYVLRLEPKETIAEWLRMVSLISELGGCCVFLSHPEYKLLDNENLHYYEELLNAIASDKEAWLTTPRELPRKAGEQNAS
jgi:peptidoglycan/xylan/chitin deacetylase (PgdA/CDA1 family)